MIATKTAKVAARKIRCAIYTRKSSEEGLEQEFNSLDAQREAAEAYIASQKSQGWVCLNDHYDDGGFTGGNTDRPALARLLADVAAGKIDCVVVYKVDRLSRSLMDFAGLISLFDKHNVSFVSVTQNFETTSSMGRLTLNILLSFAQFEREIIGERIRDKIAAQRRKGKWAGGVPVLGYDVDRSGASPKLVINAAEAERVRKIFGLYVKLGSLLPVVRELQSRGWLNKAWTTRAGKPRGGKAFDKCGLYSLLTNPIYVGKVKHKGELFDGEHEAIVPEDQFRKVQAQLQHNGRTGGIEVRNRYGALLKRLLYCKACGRVMVHTFTGRGSKRYRYYTCTHAIKAGRRACPSRSLPAGEIERVVVDQIRCIGQDTGLLADMLQQADQHLDAELARVNVQCRELERQLARDHAEIRRLAVQGHADGATAGRIAELNERIRHGETHIVDLREQKNAAAGEKLSEDELKAAFEDFDNVWGALSPREQAEVLRLLIARVDYDAAKSKVSVTFHPSGIKALARGQFQEEAA
ncbi:MAG: recombinase family protein [Phycisphaerae bacterium]